MKITTTVILVLVLCADATAQPAAPNEAATPAVRMRASPPFVEPGHELKGLALVTALRGGGYVLYMRHAAAGWARPECPDESGLTDAGEEQARQVGAALRDLKVPITEVRASETCRAKDTARLLDVGPVRTSADLNPTSMRRPVADYAQQFKYLLESPPPGSNILLVSHVQGSQTVEERILIELAEVVLYRFRGTGKAEPLARIPVAAWAGLIAAAQAAPAK